LRPTTRSWPRSRPILPRKAWWHCPGRPRKRRRRPTPASSGASDRRTPRDDESVGFGGFGGWFSDRRYEGVGVGCMKVLVVGGAGYIGSHMVKMLRGAGAEVVVLDDLSGGHRESVGDAPLRVGDIGD